MLYINDLPERLTSTSKLFADDTICHNDATDPQDQKDFQQDLDSLADREQRWKLSVHLQRCTAVNITRRRTVFSHHNTSSTVTLSTETEARYLEVKITANLRWDAHITDVCNKANKTLGFLRRNIKTINERLKNAAYKTFVRPVLEYASPVWDRFTANNIKALEKVQRRAVRWVKQDYRRSARVDTM